MKTGVIDVGGGMRGIYAAGVFDRLLDDGVSFDVNIGISAGSANVATFLAGQRKRTYRFYIDYAFRKEYMSAGNFIKTGSYIDMDYCYGTLSRHDGEDPLDYETLKNNPGRMITIATDALTGKAKYFEKDDLSQDNYDIFKASCSIPVVNKPYPVNGVPYFDGALADSVPVKKAFELGCDKVVLVLTRLADEERQPGNDLRMSKLIKRKYPNAAAAMEKRSQIYNEGVALAKKYAKEGRALIVAPKELFGMTTLKRDRECMEKFYGEGYEDGAAVKEFLAGKR